MIKYCCNVHVCEVLNYTCFISHKIVGNDQSIIFQIEFSHEVDFRNILDQYSCANISASLFKAIKELDHIKVIFKKPCRDCFILDF